MTAVLLPLLALALASGPVSSPDRPSPSPVLERRLGNGLRVLLCPDPRASGVAVQVWYGVGSRHEPPGKTGLAHLVEHLMFTGSVHAPYPQFDLLIERHGGQNNASTDEDSTHYYEVGPGALLPLFLWLEADRLATLPEALTEEKLTAQRGVVENERRESENAPYGALELLLPELVWPRGHPYFHPVIGSHQDLAAATLEDVRSFFRRHYRPSNALLTICGHFDADEANRLVDRYFAWMPAGEAPPEARPAAPPLGPGRTRVEDAVTLPLALVAWRSPAAYGPGDAELDLAARILVQGRTAGRLHAELVERRRLAESVEAAQNAGELGGHFAVSAVALPGHSSEELADAALAVVRRLGAEGPTADELEAARATLLTELAQGMEGVGGRAAALSQVARGMGSATRWPAYVDLYRRATPASVKEAVAKLVSGASFTLSIVPRSGVSR
jgi:predicted Zn-dependent peptidase